MEYFGNINESITAIKAWSFSSTYIRVTGSMYICEINQEEWVRIGKRGKAWNDLNLGQSIWFKYRFFHNR